MAVFKSSYSVNYGGLIKDSFSIPYIKKE